VTLRNSLRSGTILAALHGHGLLPALHFELNMITCRSMRTSNAKMKDIFAAMFLLLAFLQGASATCGSYEGATCCYIPLTQTYSCNSGLTCDKSTSKCVTPCGSQFTKCCYNSATQVYSCNTGLTCNKSTWKCELPCGSEGSKCCYNSATYAYSCNTGLTCNKSTWKCEQSCGSEGSKCCYNSVAQVYSCNTGLTCNKSLWKCEKPCGALGQTPCASTDSLPLQILL
jgi:hypothetical protein